MDTNDVKNFAYLYQLIHSGQKEILLENDYILEKGEEEKFPEGITVDTDNVVIDGNGHTIDARKKHLYSKSWQKTSQSKISLYNKVLGKYCKYW